MHKFIKLLERIDKDLPAEVVKECARAVKHYEVKISENLSDIEILTEMLESQDYLDIPISHRLLGLFSFKDTDKGAEYWNNIQDEILELLEADESENADDFQIIQQLIKDMLSPSPAYEVSEEVEEESKPVTEAKVPTLTDVEDKLYEALEMLQEIKDNDEVSDDITGGQDFIAYDVNDDSVYIGSTVEIINKLNGIKGTLLGELAEIGSTFKVVESSIDNGVLLQPIVDGVLTRTGPRDDGLYWEDLEELNRSYKVIKG